MVGQSNTTNRHQELQTLGIVPITKSTHSGDKYPFVIFSAPPSGSDDYVAEVRSVTHLSSHIYPVRTIASVPIRSYLEISSVFGA